MQGLVLDLNHFQENKWSENEEKCGYSGHLGVFQQLKLNKTFSFRKGSNYTDKWHIPCLAPPNCQIFDSFSSSSTRGFCRISLILFILQHSRMKTSDVNKASWIRFCRLLGCDGAILWVLTERLLHMSTDFPTSDFRAKSRHSGESPRPSESRLPFFSALHNTNLCLIQQL